MLCKYRISFTHEIFLNGRFTWQIIWRKMVNIPKCHKNDAFPKRRKKNMNIPLLTTKVSCVSLLDLLSNFLRSTLIISVFRLILIANSALWLSLFLLQGCTSSDFYSLSLGLALEHSPVSTSARSVKYPVKG